MVVEDSRGRLVAHPALDIERTAAAALAEYGERFAPRAVLKRRRGYLLDATVKSITAARATHRLTDVHEGPVAALRTIAWLIDEAQHEGTEEMQLQARRLMPLYARLAAALQITPASMPTTTTAPTKAATGPPRARGGLRALRGGEGAAG